MEQSTIQKCFARCGFGSDWSRAASEPLSEFEFDPEDDVPLQVVKLAQELFGCDFKDLSSIDQELQSRDDAGIDFNLPASEILASMKESDFVVVDDDDDDEDENGDVTESNKISVSKANDCVQVLKQFALQTGDQRILDHVFKIDESLSDIILTKTNQTRGPRWP